ncbi:MAG: maleylacetoacetate isomerase [Acidiferrobacterales bacterium]
MQLYTYFRSSAAFRVRIALNLKRLDYQSHSVHLVRDGGQHKRPEYLELNPQGFVPTLIHDGRVLTQSLAIIEYIDEVYPDPPLLPETVGERAYVRSLAEIVACDIHPLNNQRVLKYLTGRLGHEEQARLDWYKHWIHEGFEAFETHLTSNLDAESYCYGGSPTLADVCLVPQVFNAKRFNCDLSAYPMIQQIHEHCMRLAAFQAAAPENQADAE